MFCERSYIDRNVFISDGRTQQKVVEQGGYQPVAIFGIAPEQNLTKNKIFASNLEHNLARQMSLIL